MRQTTRVEQFYKTLPKVIFFGLFSNTGISEQSDYQSTLTVFFLEKSSMHFIKDTINSENCILLQLFNSITIVVDLQ